LSITADNASSNDTMTEELADLIAHFGGQSTHMQCLLHVKNLVAKSITREFNVQTTTGNDDEELTMLADGMEEEDLQMVEKDQEGDNIDDIDGWVDEVLILMTNEHTRLENNIRPMRLALVKVSERSEVNIEQRLPSCSLADLETCI